MEEKKGILTRVAISEQPIVTEEKLGETASGVSTGSSVGTISGIPTSDNVVNIKGKDFVTYAGLLDQAHKKGLQGFEILEHWESLDMAMAWCKVSAHFVNKEGKLLTFDGIGSSTPTNTGSMTQDHPIEMANTRAKGRALRDYLNIGKAMVEEIKQGK